MPCETWSSWCCLSMDSVLGTRNKEEKTAWQLLQNRIPDTFSAQVFNATHRNMLIINQQIRERQGCIDDRLLEQMI